MSTEPNKFVIQKHTRANDVHWDLMLESGDCLQTWRLDKEPEDISLEAAGATRIFDHPLKFLTYEGPVNKGKGHAKIADAGTYEILCEDKDNIELSVDGRILKGKFTLTHIEEDKWRFSPRG